MPLTATLQGNYRGPVTLGLLLILLVWLISAQAVPADLAVPSQGWLSSIVPVAQDYRKSLLSRLILELNMEENKDTFYPQKSTPQYFRQLPQAPPICRLHEGDANRRAYDFVSRLCSLAVPAKTSASLRKR
jgi:hypothetical protein